VRFVLEPLGVPAAGIVHRLPVVAIFVVVDVNRGTFAVGTAFRRRHPSGIARRGGDEQQQQQQRRRPESCQRCR